MSKINWENHLFTTSSPDIVEICKPLREHFNITSFVYNKFYPDGSEIRLGTNPEWLKHYYNEEYFRFSQFESDPTQYEKGYVLWSSMRNHSTVLSAAREFNIDNGITLIQPGDGFCEFFFFGTTPENQDMVNFYVANIDTLEKFTLYFKDAAKDIIAKAEKSRYKIEDKYSQIQVPAYAAIQPKHIKDFIKDITPTNIVLPNGETLTNRERECCKLLLRGKSAKDIGDELFISRRTVETYIAHIKDKLSCRTKSQLIAVLEQIDLW